MNAFKSQRNRNAWEKAVKKNEGLLVGYFVACDPDKEQFEDVVAEAAIAGIDVLEIGVPGKNPKYDGDIIRRGHLRALASEDVCLYQSMEFWRELHDLVDRPVWVMGYQEDLINSGIYLELCRQSLIDALVLPDCPHETLKKIVSQTKDYNVDIVYFVNSSISNSEIKEIAGEAAIIYAQLYEGATGDPLAKHSDLSDLYSRIRTYSDAIVIAGFGVRTPERVRTVIGNGFNGVVVGSALVAKLEHKEKDSLYQLIADMKHETQLR